MLKRCIAIAAAWLLTVALAPAWALGLGQIEVKSRSGQPLIAEIPIVSSNPQELYGLQAGLASPDVYRRIGLPYTPEVAADLRFELIVDAQGKPRIRVSSQRPVEAPVVQFLVEVEWGQGRLVREYSALVDTPRTVQAPLQPPIQAPVAAPDNTIATVPEVDAPVVEPSPSTPQDAASADPVEPAAEGQQVADQADPVEAQAPDTVAAAPPPAAPLPPVLPDEEALRQVEYGSSAPVTAASVEPEPALDAGGDYQVRTGDTLSAIADALNAGGSLNQTMIALLRANPNAFIDGNINLVKAGARLQLPAADAISAIQSGEADTLVRQHVQSWRSMQAPVAQPVAVAGAAPAGDAASSQPSPAQTTASATGAAAAAGARLEIAPPSAGGAQQAGSTSGMSAGGEGDMLRQDLQQTQETLVARDAEVQELRDRVAELEQLQQDQQRLIEMKDSELAAAQQRAANTADADASPWIWIVPALLILAIAGVLLLVRRRRTGAEATPVTGRSPSWGEKAPPSRAEPVAADPPPATEVPVASIDPVAEPKPSWNSLYTPTQVMAAPASALMADTANGDPRLAKARNCLEQGDLHGARGYLNDVVANADPDDQAEATRLLRDLT